MPTSPNQESRHGIKIDSIVLHSTAGGYSGSIAWLCNPKSRASAHYVLNRDGQLANLVSEDQAAWHVRQQVGNWNMRSIGIELVDDNIRDISWMTAKQYEILIMLVSRLIRDYGIPLDRDHIKMHKELDAKSDPWGWTDSTMDQFIADVKNHLYPINEEIEEMDNAHAEELTRAIQCQNILLAAANKVEITKYQGDACFFEKDGFKVHITNGDIYTGGGFTWDMVKQK